MKETMRTSTKVLSVSALAAGAVAAGMILAGSLDLTRRAAAGPDPVPATPAPPRATSAVVLPNFADIAEQVMPAVVTISSTDIVKPDAKRRRGLRPFDGGDGNPFDFFLPPDRRRGADEEDDEVERSGGTGFLIEPDGHILTNNHVVDGADKIEVKIGDNDTYPAKVVGRDPATDLALLKIEGPRPFPTLRLGDSDRIRVGEWVMAVGDPIGFENTVTVGVVSGKGRLAGLSRATQSFENLIQTDAAINFGNSGGPLVNMSGEVIGINSAISRIAQNIGFAVPINTARKLVPMLKKGKVTRGFLGVEIKNLDRDMAEAFGLKSTEGALVQVVTKGKPGEKAGLRHGDVVTRVDDTPVKNNRELIDYISGKAPGTKVALTFIRDGKEQKTTATLESRQEEGETPSNDGDEGGVASSLEKIGIRKTELTSALRRQYRVDKDLEGGVLVTHVKNVSPAAEAGLAEGDVILEVNGVEVRNEAQYDAEMKKAGKGKWVRFYVARSVPRLTYFIAPVRISE